MASRLQDVRISPTRTLLGRTKVKVSKADKVKAATYYMERDLVGQVKNFAYWERRTISGVVNDALRAYLDGKKTDPIPEEKK